MATFISDPKFEEELQAQRAATGADRFDEVWEGVYMMAPLPNNEHQELVMELGAILREAIDRAAGDRVYPGVNLTDAPDDWTRNFRAPDLVVFLGGTTAENRGAFWTGPADLVVEIVSPGDRTREKLPFYERIGSRELLIIDRDPWQLEFYRLREGKLHCVGKSGLADAAVLASAVLPISLQLVAGPKRPQVLVRRTDGAAGQWNV